MTMTEHEMTLPAIHEDKPQKHMRHAGAISLTIALACLPATPFLHAQAAAPSPAPATDDKAIPEWVKKQADNPIKWIIQQDAKPKPVKEEKAAKKPAPKKPARDEESTVAIPAAVAPVSVRAVNSKTEPASVARPVPTPNSNSGDTAAAAPAPTPAAATAASVPAAQTLNATPSPNADAAANAAAAIPAPAEAAKPSEPVVAANPAPTLDELVPISQPQPVLPREFLQSGVKSGRVVVNFVVNPDGIVSDVVIAESSDRLLNRAVTNAVKQWIYKPITKPQPNRAEVAFQLE